MVMLVGVACPCMCGCGRHVLIVLGGVQGLEYALSCDPTLNVKDVSLLFHHYLNVCPNQGSATIRTEVRPYKGWGLGGGV